jgi:hypothetical protein
VRPEGLGYKYISLNIFCRPEFVSLRSFIYLLRDDTWAINAKEVPSFKQNIFWNSRQDSLIQFTFLWPTSLKIDDGISSPIPFSKRSSINNVINYFRILKFEQLKLHGPSAVLINVNLCFNSLPTSRSDVIKTVKFLKLLRHLICYKHTLNCIGLTHSREDDNCPAWSRNSLHFLAPETSAPHSLGSRPNREPESRLLSDTIFLLNLKAKNKAVPVIGREGT